MPKFRKKPIVIEAVEVTDLLNRCHAGKSQPPQIHEAFTRGEFRFQPDYVVIVTLEGEMRGDHGDWVIQGVNGELYPCKPDIFAATYERVDQI